MAFTGEEVMEADTKRREDKLSKQAALRGKKARETEAAAAERASRIDGAARASLAKLSTKTGFSFEMTAEEEQRLAILRAKCDDDSDHEELTELEQAWAEASACRDATKKLRSMLHGLSSLLGTKAGMCAAMRGEHQLQEDVNLALSTLLVIRDATTPLDGLGGRRPKRARDEDEQQGTTVTPPPTKRGRKQAAATQGTAAAADATSRQARRPARKAAQAGRRAVAAATGGMSAPRGQPEASARQAARGARAVGSLAGRVALDPTAQKRILGQFSKEVAKRVYAIVTEEET